MDHASTSDPLIVRLREGFDRIAFVLRADLWTSAANAGLNPTQAQVLGLLAARPTAPSMDWACPCVARAMAIIDKASRSFVVTSIRAISIPRQSGTI